MFRVGQVWLAVTVGNDELDDQNAGSRRSSEGRGQPEPADPSLRVFVALGMATVTVAFVLVLWPLLGLPNVTSAAVGAFFGMSIVVGFTSMGRAMTEGLHAWWTTRAELGRRGRREIRRSIKRGCAVDNPAFAQQGIRFAEQYRRMLDSAFSWWWTGFAAALAVISVVGGDLGGVVFFGGALLVMLVLRSKTPRRLAIIERSIEANQRLLDRQ